MALAKYLEDNIERWTENNSDRQPKRKTPDAEAKVKNKERIKKA